MKIRKVAQSAGLVATVVDNLESTSATDALSANQGRVLYEKIVGTVLYEDEIGTRENVTLNDNAENYNYIEIYYRTNVRSGSIKISDFNEKKLILPITIATDTVFIHLNKEIEISGTTITKRLEYQFTQHTTNGRTYEETNTIYIYKVIGYKY